MKEEEEEEGVGEVKLILQRTPVIIPSAHVSAHILVGVGVGNVSLGNEVISDDEVILEHLKARGTNTDILDSGP